MKEKGCRSKMEEARAKGTSTKNSSPLQAHNADGRGRQRPPKAKAKCYCHKAPARFCAVPGPGLGFQALGRSAPIRSRCPGDCRAHCSLPSPGPRFLRRRNNPPPLLCPSSLSPPLPSSHPSSLFIFFCYIDDACIDGDVYVWRYLSKHYL